MPSDPSILLTNRCFNPQCRAILRWPEPVAGAAIQCPACGTPASLKTDDLLGSDRVVRRCLVCGGVEFFIRKDFPQRIGLLIAIVFGLAATICYFYKEVVACFAILAAAVVVDAVIYLVVGRVTVCYRCRAEYRNVAYNPEHKGFDLATSEKYG